MFWLTVRHYGMRYSASRGALVRVELSRTLYDLDTGKRVS